LVCELFQSSLFAFISIPGRCLGLQFANAFGVNCWLEPITATEEAISASRRCAAHQHGIATGQVVVVNFPVLRALDRK